PITMKDYYQLSSFFANVDERGLISYFTDATPTPAMLLPSPEQEVELAKAEAAVRAADDAWSAAAEAARGRFENWLSGGGVELLSAATPVASIDFDNQVTEPPPELLYEEDTGFVEANKKRLDSRRVLAFANEANPKLPAITNTANKIVPGRRGSGVQLTGDDSVVTPSVGQIERHEAITVSAWIKPADLAERAVIFRRSGGWDDAGSMGYVLVQRGARLRVVMAHFWPGNALAVETRELITPGEWAHVTVTYDGSSSASGLKIFVDGGLADTRTLQDSLTRTISNWRGGYKDLAIGSRYRDKGFKGGVVDEFRVYDRALTPIEIKREFFGPSASVSREELFEYYVAAVDEACALAQERRTKTRRLRDSIVDKIPAITVMREQQAPRAAYVLERGAYDARGEEVVAGTPSALPEFPSDAPRNRLGLARWLLDPGHPLTARVAVNRYWQMFFGSGLVRTPEDLG
ncbi:MAG: LamG-like jellyroll fold domain-containing protein, partial [Planctomycetota bacterium]